ncbi:MAG: TetR/AcrR family transcriptional regulator [Bacteroidetes bacterium]|nr:TetR/AcrR family transcriptional regulator [Bacteroidota bacterium]
MKKMSKSERMLLEAGKDLFWKYGFRRVGVEEICAKAGLSRMTFYRYFKDKTELAKAVFSHEVEQAMADFRELMRSDLPGPEKVKRMLELKAASAKHISKDFLLDFYQHNDTGLREYVEKLSAETWRETLELFHHNQAQGVFRADLNLPFFLAFSQKMMDLAADEQFIAAAGGPEQMIMELSKLLAFGIAGQKD